MDAKSDQDDDLQNLDQPHQVLKKLLVAHETWFDVSRDYSFGGHLFPGYAEFHSHGEKYVLVKSAKLWEVDAHEYLFFEVARTLSADEVRTWIAFMTEEALKKVHPEPNHMTSYISLVLVAESVDAQAVKLIRKTRFHKEFKLGVEGWADLRLAAVSVSTKQVFTNNMGKDLVPQLESALGLPAKKKLFRR
ncbi:MAG: hypothetical protein Q4E12_00470 [Coriobacteriia bacterium]|nr:hypothetical protein [Coriobacteriia bacterium]